MVAPNRRDMSEPDFRQTVSKAVDKTNGLLTAGLDVGQGSYAAAIDVLTEDVTGPLIEIAAKMGKALERFKDAPSASTVRAAAEVMVRNGYLPIVSQAPPDFVQGNDVAKAIWKMLADEAKPLNRAGMSRARASIKLEGERLARNVEFWDNTYRLTAAVASMGVTELTDKLTGELRKLSDEVRATNVGRRRLLAMVADPKVEPAKKSEAQRALSEITNGVNSSKLALATELLQLAGFTEPELGLGRFEGLGGIGGSAAALVGRVGGLASKIPWLPPQLRSLLMGGTAAVLLGLLLLVAVLLAAVYAIRKVIETVVDPIKNALGFGSKGGGIGFVGALVILGGGYWAYKKGYLAKIGLKPAGTAA